MCIVHPPSLPPSLCPWVHACPQSVLLEALLASPHRTNDASEADYFYVPVPGACLMARAFETPNYIPEVRGGVRG